MTTEADPIHPMTAHRKRTGQSLADVAKRVGTTKSWLSRVENWLEQPSSNLIARLVADADGKLSPNDFFKPAAKPAPSEQASAP